MSDSEEINKHKTNPLKSDSDGDGLNDGEEIAIGLDPNRPETFGMPDSEYKVTQKISADSEAMSQINTEESPYELSLEISATGNAATRLSANDSAYSAVTESDARLGGAVELRYLGEVDKVKLTYKIADEYIPNSGENSGKSLDLQGIKRYNIFRYFEEINMLLPVATEVDEENNTLSAETDELGTYCVLDMEVLMRNFGIEPEGTYTETVTQQMYSAPPAAKSNKSKSDTYCVTFIIDIRKGAFTPDQLSTILNEINQFMVNSYLEQRDITLRIVVQGATDFRTVKHMTRGDFQTPVELLAGRLDVGALTAASQEGLLGSVLIVTDALSDIVENYDESANNFVFDIYNQQNAVFEQGVADELCKNAKKNKVNISIISRSSNKLTGFQKRLTDDTDGIKHTKSFDFVKEVYEHVYKEKYFPKEALLAFLSTGFEYVVLDSKLYPNGKNPYGKNADTDKDGITDWDEVRNDLLIPENDGSYTLPTVRDCMNSLGDVPFYVENAFRDAEEAKIFFSYFLDFEILPIKSDPTNADGDEDGLGDAEEKKVGTNPLNCDTESDGIWDGDECYIGTNPFFSDTDGDGLSDGFEVELWFDPLNRNPDGDKYDDYEEWKNGTNPYVYDYTNAEKYHEFCRGVALGSWNGTADNIPQLIGQIVGSLLPFAGARDYFADIFKNQDTLAALWDLGGFLVDLATYGGDIATNIAGIASKLGKFISQNADDAPKVVEAITQTSKQLSKGTDALPALVKEFDAKTINNIGDSLKNTKNITRADYSKSLNILEIAGKNVDSGKSILSTLNSVDAMRVAKLVDKHGSNVVDIVSACGPKNIYLIPRVIDLCGSNAGKLDKLSKVFELCGNDINTANHLLRTLTKHSDTMLKALEKCDKVNTIKQYLLIADRFGDNFDTMAENNLFFRDFRGLEKVINDDTPALAFTYKIKPNGEIDDSFCVVTKCNIEERNPSISIECPINEEPIKFYSQLLTEDGIDGMLKRGEIKGKNKNEIAKELKNLAKAIQKVHDNAPKNNNFQNVSGIPNDYSNEPWVITNCAEIWGAFEMILQGGNFDDLGLSTFYNRGAKKGVLHNPCENCSKIFAKQIARMIKRGN